MTWSCQLVDSGGQVYLIETWVLTTGLQWCSEDRVIVGNSAAKIGSFKLGQNCD